MHRTSIEAITTGLYKGRPDKGGRSAALVRVLFLLLLLLLGATLAACAKPQDVLPPFDPASAQQLTPEKRKEYDLLFSNESAQTLTPEQLIYIYIKRNDVNGITRLVRQGINLHIAHHFGWPPLFAAAQMGKVDVVRAMIEAGANPNHPQIGKGEGGEIPILAAMLEWMYGISRMGQPWPTTGFESDNWFAIARLLLDKGVDVNAQFNWGKVKRTYLSLAVQYNNLSIAKLLIAKGSDVNLPRNSSWAPLFLAVHNRNVEMVQLLLEHGANMYANSDASDQLTSPITDAGYNSPEVAMLFLDRGADPNKFDLLYNALVDKNHELLQKLITKGVDINTLKVNIDKQKKQYRTPLSLAVEQEDFVAIRLLLNAGANACSKEKAEKKDVDKSDQKGATVDVMLIAKLLEIQRIQQQAQERDEQLFKDAYIRINNRGVDYNKLVAQVSHQRMAPDQIRDLWRKMDQEYSVRNYAQASRDTMIIRRRIDKQVNQDLKEPYRLLRNSQAPRQRPNEILEILERYRGIQHCDKAA